MDSLKTSEKVESCERRQKRADIQIYRPRALRDQKSSLPEPSKQVLDKKGNDAMSPSTEALVLHENKKTSCEYASTSTSYNHDHRYENSNIGEFNSKSLLLNHKENTKSHFRKEKLEAKHARVFTSEKRGRNQRNANKNFKQNVSPKPSTLISNKFINKNHAVDDQIISDKTSAISTSSNKSNFQSVVINEPVLQLTRETFSLDKHVQKISSELFQNHSPKTIDIHEQFSTTEKNENSYINNRNQSLKIDKQFTVGKDALPQHATNKNLFQSFHNDMNKKELQAIDSNKISKPAADAINASSLDSKATLDVPSLEKKPIGRGRGRARAFKDNECIEHKIGNMSINNQWENPVFSTTVYNSQRTHHPRLDYEDDRLYNPNKDTKPKVVSSFNIEEKKNPCNSESQKYHVDALSVEASSIAHQKFKLQEQLGEELQPVQFINASDDEEHPDDIKSRTPPLNWAQESWTRTEEDKQAATTIASPPRYGAHQQLQYQEHLTRHLTQRQQQARTSAPPSVRGMLSAPGAYPSNIPLQQITKQLFNPDNPSKPLLVPIASRDQPLVPIAQHNSLYKCGIGDVNYEVFTADHSTITASQTGAYEELMHNIQKGECDIQYYVHSNQIPREFPRIMDIRLYLQNCYAKLFTSNIILCHQKNIEAQMWKTLYYNIIGKN